MAAPTARLSAALVLALVATGARGAAAETVELIPERRAGWSPTNIFAPLTSVFLGGFEYWYDPRVVEIDTDPPGAYLDLFYVRGTFQKAYQQAQAPATVVLPSRIEAEGRDTLTIRVIGDGFKQKHVRVRVRSRTSELVIGLEPLDNELLDVSHFYLAGRSSLTFHTKEALTFRTREEDDGFALVLVETANTNPAHWSMRALASPVIDAVEDLQLGEDLVVHVTLAAASRDREVRARRSKDPVSGRHRFTLDLVAPGDDTAEIERSLAALARIRPEHVYGCGMLFDQALRETLDQAALSRALTPRDRFMDRYIRATIRRLGEVSPNGFIRLLDGTVYDVSVPIELSAAASQASSAEGYLALLRQFVVELESPDHWRGIYRGLVAPEVNPASFDAMVSRAEGREQRCRALLAEGAAPARAAAGP